jgi:phosphoribulokinase
MKVVKVDCKNVLIKQAIEEDVTLYEAMQNMNFRLAKNKEYPTISIMLNALFLEHKDEIIIEATKEPQLLKK